MGLNPVAVTQISVMARVLSKDFLDIQVTIECRFIQNLVRDMIITYNQILFPVSGLYFSEKKTDFWRRIKSPETKMVDILLLQSS